MNPGSFALAEDDNPRHQRTTLLPVILKPAQTAEEPIFSLRTRWILDPSLSLRMTSRATIYCYPTSANSTILLKWSK